MREHKEISKEINERFESLYQTSQNGFPVPYVCVLCDRLLKPKEVKIVSMELIQKNSEILKGEINNVDPELRREYTLPEAIVPQGNEWIYETLLSPCASFLQKGTKWKKDGFAACNACKYALEHYRIPKFAIANNYAIGMTPACITALSRVELALLSPVKAFGYCFMYTTGTFMKPPFHGRLKGSLCYYKVAHESIARSLTQTEVLGLNNDIVVILYGYMTPEQKRTARRMNRVHTGRLLTALEWLITHNMQWRQRGINLEAIRQELQDPALIDMSKEKEWTAEQNLSQNVEKCDSFQIFFPDGTMSTLNGGQNTMTEFKTMIKAQKDSGFDIELKGDLQREYVADYKDDNLVNACIMQYPYGRGGINERRERGDGTFTSTVNLEEYIEYVARLSPPQFHDDLFCLILYNIKMKQRMVTTAGWRVRTGLNAKILSENLTSESIEEALTERVKDVRSRGDTPHPGKKFMSAIDAIACSVPHTNEAANQALSQGEAMQYVFGQPSFFLTISPDDNNSFLVQLYNWTQSEENDVRNMTNERVEMLGQAREKLRIEVPGISAFVFEMILDIVMESVVGWNTMERKPTDLEGLFGKPMAISATIEEQNRGTLHAHILIYVHAFNVSRNDLHSTERRTKRAAEQIIISIVNNLTSTDLIGNKYKTDTKTFPHPCTEHSTRNRSRPQCCSNETLRALRHKDGYAKHGSEFLSCKSCSWKWSSTEVVQTYLKSIKNINQLERIPDQTGRLGAMMIEYQKGSTEMDSDIAHAMYDTHIHTKSCFRYNKTKKRKLEDMECRFRYPRMTKQKTAIADICDEKTAWFSWNGLHEKRHLKEVQIKRAEADAFQNESCTAIMNSKLACNTNITALMPGAITYYIFKYNLKGTQEEDQEAYVRVATAARKALSRAQQTDNNTSPKSAGSIAISRLLSGSYAHQKTNVVKGCLASYLTRNNSRFIFSHQFVWCPTHDIHNLLNGGNAKTSVYTDGKTQFFECIAMHYLCRPKQLEQIHAFDFYSEYKVVRNYKSSQDTEYTFENGVFTHPSYCENNKSFRQTVKQREEKHLVRFCKYIFPDSAQFRGDILDVATPISDLMEEYSMNALILFHSYRTIDDLKVNNSYTKKLRQIFNGNSNQPRIQKIQQILQNVQDVRANATRIRCKEDELQRTTQPYAITTHDLDDNMNDDGNEEEADMQDDALEHLLDMLNLNMDEGNGNNTHIPDSLDLSGVRNIGTHGCGYKLVAKMKTAVPKTAHTNFIDNDVDPFFDTEQQQQQQDSSPARPNNHFTNRDIMDVFLTRTARRSRQLNNVLNTETSEPCLEANGSVASIIDWAQRANIDINQRRAFEIFSATFVLTFHYDAEIVTRTRQHELEKERIRLEKLIEQSSRKSTQLICFLHGPAGCGKTTVVDLFIEYARAFCDYLPNFTYTTETIVITAMSGVAATLLMGETTHRALHLNKKTNVKPEHVEAFEETRMVIVDEISFASTKDIHKINKNLTDLKQKNSYELFGGVHIIFSGDLRQLLPVAVEKRDLLYADNRGEFENFVNCYIELNGTHRYSADPEWGEILRRFRTGTATLDDVDTINTRRFSNSDLIPDNVRYATHKNNDRDAINAALFETRCESHCNGDGIVEDSMMIFSDRIKTQNSAKQYVPLKNCHQFWESCGENSIQTGAFDEGRTDPVLRLYESCRVMLPYNKCVSNGQANGTQALIKSIQLKHGVEPKLVTLRSGCKVKSVFAHQVNYVQLEHCNERVQPKEFSVQPIEYKRAVNILKPGMLQVTGHDRESIRMSFYQLPLLINNATTVHKLQGSGVDQILVHEWSYATNNWVYVVISRVKTLSGLFIRIPLSRDLRKYAMPQNLSDFLQRMQQNKAPTYWTEEQYENLFFADN